MAARKNPVEGFMDRVKNSAAKIDSVMKARMPKDFQDMHKRKEKRKEGY